MGDYAEMMLDGTCCEGCGEFIGDPIGHPRYCSAQCGGSRGVEFSKPVKVSHGAKQNAKHNRERHEAAKEAKPFECKDCHRLFRKEVALRDHRRDVHKPRAEPLRMTAPGGHTAGPWCIPNGDGNELLICDGESTNPGACLFVIGPTTSNPLPYETLAEYAALIAQAPTLLKLVAELEMHLKAMTDTFKPFTMKLMGGEGSSARADQDHQIAIHAAARSALDGKARV